MPTVKTKPDITVKARVGKTYQVEKRKGSITEVHVPISEWGKLQGVIVREAARGLGIERGAIVLRLFRPDGAGNLVTGSLSLVRRGARARET